jgi:hypothetical protein
MWTFSARPDKKLAVNGISFSLEPNTAKDQTSVLHRNASPYLSKRNDSEACQKTGGYYLVVENETIDVYVLREILQSM